MIYPMSTISHTQKANYSAQDVFKRSISDILRQNQSGGLHLDEAETRIVPFASVKAAQNAHPEFEGDTRFSLLSYTQSGQRLGTAVLNVYTSDSFELTNMLLGNIEDSYELSFFQNQELSQVSKSLFKTFLRLLERHANQPDLFTALTLTDGKTDYESVQSGAGEGLVLTATLPYTIPSIGNGYFHITIQVN